MRKGAEQLYTAYRASGLSLKQIETRHQRISHIKALLREGVLDDDLRYRSRATPKAEIGDSRHRLIFGPSQMLPLPSLDGLLDDATIGEQIFTLPEQPDLIPYRTSYYAENSGFCMAHEQLAALPDGSY